MKTPICYGFIAMTWIVAGSPASAAAAEADVGRLFDPQRVIEVHIQMEEGDWDRLRFQTRSLFEALQNDRAESPFTYFKADVTVDGLRIRNAGIRKKGFLGSLDETRPSLKIRFDKYADQAPYGSLDRLTLNNNKQDSSKLSQFLAYKLFNESGTFASRCNLAKVTVNGQYLGIYSNVESVKKPMLARGFGDGSGALYEGTVADLLGAAVHKLETKNKRADVADLAEVVTVLAAERLDLEALESQVDVQAFIRFWALESLIGFWDGYAHNQNNFFIYKNPVNGKYYFLPWGVDSAFTNSVPGQIDPIRIKSVHHQSALANRLYHEPATRERYRQTLLELLDEHWNEEVLLAEVDRVEQLVQDDIHESIEDYSKQVEKVRRFIRGRRRALERELNRWPIALTKGPRQPGYTTEVGTGQVTFATEWFPRSPGKPETRGSVDMNLTLAGETVSFRQIGATAEPSRDGWGSQGGNKPPSIVMSGIQEPSGKRLTLAMGLSAESFRPTAQPVSMFGVVIEGNFLFFLARAIFNPSRLVLVEGRGTFDEASMEAGAPVAGKLELKIMKFEGGQSPTVEWRE